MPSLVPESDWEDRQEELSTLSGAASSPTSKSLSLPPGLRRRDVAATPDDVDTLVVLDAGSFGLVVAGVIRGKHLARHAVTHDFLHNAFDHSEARVLRFLPDALCDAEVWWSTVIVENPCEACITGDTSRLGPSGSLPRTEGLTFLDVWHYIIPDIITGCMLQQGASSERTRTGGALGKVAPRVEAQLSVVR